MERSSDFTVPVPCGVTTNIEESEFQMVLLQELGPMFKLTGRAYEPNTEPQSVTREFPVAGPFEKTTAVILGAMYSKYASGDPGFASVTMVTVT